jgi:hypothetical protein
MSLDARLRDGLREAADSVDPHVETWLARTRQLHGRRRTTRQLVLAAVAVVVLLVAFPVVDRLARTDQAVPTSLRTDAQARRLLLHTWVTPVVTRDQVATSLRSAGLEQHLDVVAVDQGYPVALTMVLARKAYAVSSARGVLIDHGDWSVHGSTLHLRPTECRPCELTFRWIVRDDRLTLTLLTDASPALDGVPDEAYAQALYATVPFTRFSLPSP